jgi:hypothetical protein
MDFMISAISIYYARIFRKCTIVFLVIKIKKSFHQQFPLHGGNDRLLCCFRQTDNRRNVTGLWGLCKVFWIELSASQNTANLSYTFSLLPKIQTYMYNGGKSKIQNRWNWNKFDVICLTFQYEGGEGKALWLNRWNILQKGMKLIWQK